MITPSREEILLVLRGSFSETFDESLGKWKGPFILAKFQILQSENDFMLRISTDSVKLSDPLIFISCKKISSVKKLNELLLQINLRSTTGTPGANIKFCIKFNVPEDHNHFFLILKNAAEELKSRVNEEDMNNRLNPPGSPTKPTNQDFFNRINASSPQHPNKRPPLPPKPRLSPSHKTESSRAPMAAMAAPGTSYMFPQAGVSSGSSESLMKGTEVESLLATLQRQIAVGDSTGASETVANLAKKKTKLSMSVDEIGNMPGNRSKFDLEVCVEDHQSSGARINLKNVTPNMTIGYLKRMVFLQYNFPVEVQRWIIGRRIIRDVETLMACRINSSTPVFLYLISAEKAGITQDGAQLSRDAMMAQFMQFITRQVPAPIPLRDPQTMPAVAVNPGPRLPARNTQPARELPVFSIPPSIHPISLAPRKPTAEEVGWHCTRCTLINPPTVPGCRVCMENRPDSYQIPALDSYIMDPEEKAKQDELLRNEKLMQESLAELQEPDQTGLLPSLDEEYPTYSDLTLNDIESD